MFDVAVEYATYIENIFKSPESFGINNGCVDSIILELTNIEPKFIFRRCNNIEFAYDKESKTIFMSSNCGGNSADIYKHISTTYMVKCKRWGSLIPPLLHEYGHYVDISVYNHPTNFMYYKMYDMYFAKKISYNIFFEYMSNCREEFEAWLFMSKSLKL